MIVVIFEVTPVLGQRHSYLDLANRLRPRLQEVDGFISIERFESLSLPARSFRYPSGATRRRS